MASQPANCPSSYQRLTAIRRELNFVHPFPGHFLVPSRETSDASSSDYCAAAKLLLSSPVTWMDASDSDGSPLKPAAHPRPPSMAPTPPRLRLVPLLLSILLMLVGVVVLLSDVQGKPNLPPPVLQQNHRMILNPTSSHPVQHRKQHEGHAQSAAGIGGHGLLHYLRGLNEVQMDALRVWGRGSMSLGTKDRLAASDVRFGRDGHQ